MAKKKDDEKLEAALATRDENALAAEVDNMFGGPEAPLPIDVAPPQVKMTKTSDFEMPDDTKVQELVGYMVFAKKSRAYYITKYTGGKGIPPDCASDNCRLPNENIEKPCSGNCGEKLCEKATWRKIEEDGIKKNVIDCKESLNLIFLPEGKVMPIYMRIRSLSMNPKSPIAVFFASCKDPTFAYRGKFQTVKVRLTLKEIEKNGFKTSMLQVEKISTLEATDPLLPVLGRMFQKLAEGFVVVHEDDAASDAPVHEHSDTDQSQEYDPENPPEDGNPI